MAIMMFARGCGSPVLLSILRQYGDRSELSEVLPDVLGAGAVDWIQALALGLAARQVPESLHDRTSKVRPVRLLAEV